MLHSPSLGATVADHSTEFPIFLFPRFGSLERRQGGQVSAGDGTYTGNDGYDFGIGLQGFGIRD